MKVGLIARCEDRGLGVMTHAFHRNMRPDKTLLIRPAGNIARGFAQYPERFPEATMMEWDGGFLPEDRVRMWLDGLDVVYSAETFYDHRIVEWCRELGVATVLHAMPELWNPDWPRPTRIWLPTGWREEYFPEPVIVPVPVEMATPAPGFPVRPERLRVLHVAGHRAMADRNGTLTFLQALRMVREPIDATMLCQDRRGPRANGIPARTAYKAILGPQTSIEPYLQAADVLVMPRRYGGLCLPVQEGLAHGVVPIMPGTPPNAEWPTLMAPITPDEQRTIQTAAGTIPVIHVEPRAIAFCIDQLAGDRDLLDGMRFASRKWATEHSWDLMAPKYRMALQEAAERVLA